jgi:hypothetical protein
MNNKYIYIAAALVGVAGIWYFTSQHKAPEAVTDAISQQAPGSVADTQSGAISTTTTAATATASPSAEVDPTLPATVQERMSAIQARRPNLRLDANTLQTKMAQPIAWSSSEEIPKHLPLKPEEFTDGRQFISVDDLKIETLMPGDQVNIQTPDTKNNYEVVIDSVEKHDYNSISWHGHINGADGQTYAVSFTRGESLTVAGFSTPDGHYVLQGHGKDGWIASSDLLYKQDTSVSDAINPEDVINAESHAHSH